MVCVYMCVCVCWGCVLVVMLRLNNRRVRECVSALPFASSSASLLVAVKINCLLSESHLPW